MNDKNSAIISCLILTVVIAFCLAINRFGFRLIDNWQPRALGDKYTCKSNGCALAYESEGEFEDEVSCSQICRSFVKKDQVCREIQGVPWDSFATKRVCENS